eukprot:scaffold25585_cov112-Isochrysis_galbana.AAC.2
MLAPFRSRRFLEWPALPGLLEPAEQVAVGRKLGHNVQHVLLDKGLEKGDDVRAGHRGQYADLVHSLRPVFGAHPARVHLLDGIRLAVGLTRRLIHSAEAALAEQLLQHKAVDAA